MGRLTLRLPEALHRQLKTLAENEGVSLNQYIVYALTRQSTLAYTVQPVSEQTVKEQRAAYTALLQNLGQASFEEIEAVMSEREEVQPEAGLSSEVVARLQERFVSERQLA